MEWNRIKLINFRNRDCLPHLHSTDFPEYLYFLLHGSRYPPLSGLKMASGTWKTVQENSYISYWKIWDPAMTHKVKFWWKCKVLKFLTLKESLCYCKLYTSLSWTGVHIGMEGTSWLPLLPRENSSISPKSESSWDDHRFPEKVSESVSKGAIEREIPECSMPLCQWWVGYTKMSRFRHDN